MFVSGRLSWGDESPPLWAFSSLPEYKTTWMQTIFFIQSVQWSLFFTAVYTGTLFLLWPAAEQSLSLSHFRWCPSERWPGESEWRSQRPHPRAAHNEKPERLGGPEAPLLGCQLWKWGNGGMRGSGHGVPGGGCSSSPIHVEKAPASGQSYYWCWGGEWGARHMEGCRCCTR